LITLLALMRGSPTVLPLAVRRLLPRQQFTRISLGVVTAQMVDVITPRVWSPLGCHQTRQVGKDHQVSASVKNPDKTTGISVRILGSQIVVDTPPTADGRNFGVKSINDSPLKIYRDVSIRGWN
jgi:hypothetical protein